MVAKGNQIVWYIYMLELNNGNYYTGITNNISTRMKTHAEGKGSKCVRASLPFKIVYVEGAADRSAASKREAAIKKLKKVKKVGLLSLETNEVSKWK